MAQTTTHFTGQACVIQIDDASSTLDDVSGSASSASLSSEPGSTGEVYTFDGDNPITGVGKRKYTISAEMVMSTSTTEFAYYVLDWMQNKDGEAKTVTIQAPDASTGSYQWTGEWKLTNAEIPLTASDATPVLGTIELMSSGTITWSVI